MHECDLGMLTNKLEVQTTQILRNTGGKKDGINEDLQTQEEAASQIDSLTEQLIEIINSIVVSKESIKIIDIIAVMQLFNNGLLTEYYKRRFDKAKISALEDIKLKILSLLSKEIEDGKHIELLMENPTASAESFELVCAYVLAGHYEPRVIGPLSIALNKLPRLGYSGVIDERYLSVKVKDMIRRIADGIATRGMSQEMAEEFKNFARYNAPI